MYNKTLDPKRLNLTSTIICAIASLVVVFFSLILVFHMYDEFGTFTMLFSGCIFSGLFIHHMNALDAILKSRKRQPARIRPRI